MVTELEPVLAHYAVAGELGYDIGSKKYRSLTSFQADLQKAFGKTFIDDDSLVVRVEFYTKNRGICNITMKKADYATKYALMQRLLNATKYTLDTLLA